MAATLTVTPNDGNVGEALLIEGDGFLPNTSVEVSVLSRDLDVKFEIILQQYGDDNKINPTEEEVLAELSRLDNETKKSYDYDEERLKRLITYYFVNNRAYLAIFKEIKDNNK
jgi:hypothetical protein